MNRRDFINTLIITVTPATLMTGCLPLLRLVVGRGLVRPFRLAGRGGKTAALYTLGRGVAVGARVAAAARVGIPQTRILSPRGNTLAISKPAAEGIQLLAPTTKGPRDIRILYSRHENESLYHYDVNEGYVGRTIAVSRDRIDFYADRPGRERLTSYDILIRGGRLIRHFSKDGEVLGETKVQVSGSSADIVADEEMQAYFEGLFAAAEFTCEAAAEQYAVIESKEEACDAGDRQACKDIKLHHSGLERIRENCGR